MINNELMVENEKKLLQAKHRLEAAEARDRKKERSQRTRRLIQVGAILESVFPEIEITTEKTLQHNTLLPFRVHLIHEVLPDSQNKYLRILKDAFPRKHTASFLRQSCIESRFPDANVKLQP